MSLVSSRPTQYTYIIDTYLLRNFPHALQTAEQVAAPQQEAPNVKH